MRFLLSTVLIALLSFLVAIYLSVPWWSFAVIAFIVTLILPNSIGKSFLSGFLAIFLLWGLIALWIDIKNDSSLSGKMAELFNLQGSGFLLIIITAFIGGLIAGLASVSATSLMSRQRQKQFS